MAGFFVFAFMLNKCIFMHTNLWKYFIVNILTVLFIRITFIVQVIQLNLNFLCLLFQRIVKILGELQASLSRYLTQPLKTMAISVITMNQLTKT